MKSNGNRGRKIKSRKCEIAPYAIGHRTHKLFLFLFLFLFFFLFFSIRLCEAHIKSYHEIAVFIFLSIKLFYNVHTDSNDDVGFFVWFMFHFLYEYIFRENLNNRMLALIFFMTICTCKTYYKCSWSIWQKQKQQFLY